MSRGCKEGRMPVAGPHRTNDPEAVVTIPVTTEQLQEAVRGRLRTIPVPAHLPAATTSRLENIGVVLFDPKTKLAAIGRSTGVAAGRRKTGPTALGLTLVWMSPGKLRRAPGDWQILESWTLVAGLPEKAGYMLLRLRPTTASA